MTDTRVAVVTGAGNGLGRAHALALAGRGVSVVVNDIGTSPDGYGESKEAADSVVAEITAAGGTAVASYDSVATEDGAERAVQTALEAFGRVDILVNNAGVIRNQPIGEIVTEDWDLVLRTHLYGAMYCTRAASKSMVEHGWGRIVCTASHIGLGAREHATYSAAKEGLAGFGRSVARELRPHGVTCNIIRPVAIWRGRPPASLVAGARPDQPELPREDIAALVSYLTSEEAGNITACVFEIWGGHVGIFTDPPPVEQVVLKQEGSWTTKELADILPVTLTANRSIDHLPHSQPPWLRSFE